MPMRTPLRRDSSSFGVLAGGGQLPTQLLLITSLGLAVTGCLADELDVSTTSQAATVSTYVSSGCTTAVVLGLSKQIADEISCESSTLLKRFTPTANLQLTSNAVLPYLASGAKTALESVAATRTVQINSAFRTVAQQYLLYRWSQAGRCGIGAAATPGRSNHETGRALDVQNYSSLVSAMGAKQRRGRRPVGPGGDWRLFGQRRPQRPAPRPGRAGTRDPFAQACASSVTGRYYSGHWSIPATRAASGAAQNPMDPLAADPGFDRHAACSFGRHKPCLAW